MKKGLAIILALVMILSLCACGTSNAGSGYSGDSNISTKPTKPTESSMEQYIVNECCDYSNVTSIKGLDIGTFNTKWSESENAWITTVKGTYYPCDAYGKMGDKMQFDMTFEGTRNTKCYCSKVRY